MNKCPNCNHDIPSGATLCRNCGWEPPTGGTWPPAVWDNIVPPPDPPNKWKVAGLVILGAIAGSLTATALSVVYGIGIIVGPIIGLINLRREKSPFNWGFLAGSFVPLLVIVGAFVSCMASMRR